MLNLSYLLQYWNCNGYYSIYFPDAWSGEDLWRPVFTDEQYWYNIMSGILMTRGGIGGYKARPKIHVKRVIFHNRALYVRNVNRASNSCKIGQKGCDFLDLTYLYRVVLCKFCIKGYDLWTSYLGLFSQVFLRTLCLKDSLNCTCLGIKLLHHYF